MNGLPFQVSSYRAWLAADEDTELANFFKGTASWVYNSDVVVVNPLSYFALRGCPDKACTQIVHASAKPLSDVLRWLGLQLLRSACESLRLLLDIQGL